MRIVAKCVGVGSWPKSGRECGYTRFEDGMGRRVHVYVPADQLDFEEGRWYVLTVTAMGAGE